MTLILRYSRKNNNTLTLSTTPYKFLREIHNSEVCLNLTHSVLIRVSWFDTCQQILSSYDCWQRWSCQHLGGIPHNTPIFLIWKMGVVLLQIHRLVSDIHSLMFFSATTWSGEIPTKNFLSNQKRIAEENRTPISFSTRKSGGHFLWFWLLRRENYRTVIHWKNDEGGSCPRVPCV